MCFFVPQLAFFSFRTKFSETAQAEEKTENKKSGIGSGEDPRFSLCSSCEKGMTGMEPPPIKF